MPRRYTTFHLSLHTTITRALGRFHGQKR